jgi:hypothetical protein
VSHETIYRSLFIQARGPLNKELQQYLRRTRAMRRLRHHTQKSDNHGRITDTLSISERPASVEDRAVPGHWEGDLVDCKDGRTDDVIHLIDSHAAAGGWSVASGLTCPTRSSTYAHAEPRLGPTNGFGVVSPREPSQPCRLPGPCILH